MKQDKCFFAVDLGATSGRTIIGTLADEKIVLEELTRFNNELIETGNHIYWDIYALYNEIIKGLRIVAQRNLPIESIGIDTWGCDFVFVGNDGELMRNPLAYRDSYTEGAMDDYFKNAIGKKEVYDITGIQFMNFNSLFQLYTMKKAENTALQCAKTVLFIPDALSYMLTGKKVCEYTVASTSQMQNPRTGELDKQLLKSVGLDLHNFGKPIRPSNVVGVLNEQVQRITGLGAIPVVAVAGHDTASAVAAVPSTSAHFAYLSSGTWSLMGIETSQPIINERSYELNFTNEGGIEGTTRLLKNICGMWLYERVRKEWDEAKSRAHAELMKEATACEPFRSLIMPDDTRFANPESMTNAIQDYCKAHGEPVPESYAQLFRCIFDSLALRYKQVFGWLQELAPYPIDTLHIIGGGSQNALLNQFTANAIGVDVYAGPQEATAIGNIMLQAKAAGVVSDIRQMRASIAKSFTPQHFIPQDRQQWDDAYQRYLEIVK